MGAGQDALCCGGCLRLIGEVRVLVRVTGQQTRKTPSKHLKQPETPAKQPHKSCAPRAEKATLQAPTRCRWRRCRRLWPPAPPGRCCCGRQRRKDKDKFPWSFFFLRLGELNKHTHPSLCIGFLGVGFALFLVWCSLSDHCKGSSLASQSHGTAAFTLLACVVNEPSQRPWTFL